MLIKPLSSLIPEFKEKLLLWANSFEVCCVLDNNHFTSYPYNDYELLVAAGSTKEITVNWDSKDDPFVLLQSFIEKEKSWKFGFLGYDLKNNIENLNSENQDQLQFPDLHFFTPEHLVTIDNTGRVKFITENPEAIIHSIMGTALPIKEENKNPAAILQSRTPKERYIEKVQKIKNYIEEGDVYELNFCQEFFIENFEANPLKLFEALNVNSLAPFSAYYRFYDRYIMSASPERFLKKKNDTVVSQPIKGTIARGKTQLGDELLKDELFRSTKDRAENVMIVDLVRNDLSKSCTAGTVAVEELFGIYSFKQVNQMVSTITGKLKDHIHPVQVIKNAFPMGSMTGAPKVKSMELIESLEESKRGIYSGAIGYFTPEQDFDLNVIIRSLIYNKTSKYLSFHVGGAIVYDSDPQKEYDECLLKSKAMLEALGI